MGSKSLVLCFLGGLLFGAAVPPCPLAPLAWVGVAPLLFVNAQPIRWQHRIFAALCWCISAAILPVSFSIAIAVQEGAKPLPLEGWLFVKGWLFTLLPFLLLGLIVGTVAAISGRLWQQGNWRGWSWVWGVAALGVIAEWLSQWLPLPINLALTQSSLTPFVWTAWFGGIWLASWFVWLANAFVTLAVLQPRTKLGVVAELLVLILLFWILLVAVYPIRSPPERITVVAVQSQLTPLEMAIRWATARKSEGTRLIVLPEGALGHETEAMREALAKAAKEAKAFLVAGFFESGSSPANAAALFDPDGREVLRHRKVHLLLGERLRYRKGREINAYPPFGIAICFETCFPDVIRRLVKQGAKVVAVPNHDPPSIGYLIHHLHAAFLPFRAVENHVAIVKADATGLSQIFDIDGDCRVQAPLGRETVIDAPVGLAGGSLYTFLGDWFVAICAVTLVWLLLRPLRRRAGEGR